MISDSIPWKDELLKVATSLEKRTRQRRWTERSSFLVERDVMVSAYALRKLSESRKMSDSLSARPVTVTRYPLISKSPDLWSAFEFWKLYDLDREEHTTLTLTAFCNQIIHSWVWTQSVNENGYFDGIFVCSDFESRKFVYMISAEMLVDLFRLVALEDVASKTMRRDKDGHMQVVQILTSDEMEALRRRAPLNL